MVTYSGHGSQAIAQLLFKRLKIADVSFEKAEIEAVVRRIYQKQGPDRG